MHKPVEKNISSTQKTQDFVDCFRNSAPYIHSHRHRTFVISFTGEALQSKFFTHLVHDLALLNSLGIRLVLVHGIRPQIEQRLQQHNAPSHFHKQLRITDDLALACAKEAAGMAKVEIEALLSMGLANSPMSGAKIQVTSGNFITAKPIGVLESIDHGHTGQVRKIDSAAIHQHLDNDSVVLISPIGYSPSGEVFNLGAENVATECAIALKAEKLVFITEESLDIAQMTTAEAQIYLQNHPDLTANLKKPLSAALQGCLQGVDRSHLINRKVDGALLLELFSRNGIGTLISAMEFEALRQANLSDIGGILELIIPLEIQGKLVKRSREKLEMEITDYYVIEIDGMIIGCAALHKLHNSTAGLISCVAVHPDYQCAARGNHLLAFIQNQARKKNIHSLYILTTQTMQWFEERGFSHIDIEQLPQALNNHYSKQRNSKALLKILSND